MDAVTRLTVGTLQIEVHADRRAAGMAAAQAASDALPHVGDVADGVGVLFAAAASQIAMLDALTATSGIAWDQISGFHLDEYLGIAADHPGSFRQYLREHLTSRVKLRAFHEMGCLAGDVSRCCSAYVSLLEATPPQLGLLGIGENGHLAFNDPHAADFNDPEMMKVVRLDEDCRQQQVAEGWFGNLEEVPRRAITLTITAIQRVPKLIVSVPGRRKAHIMRRTLTDPISPACPATILRQHPDATVYLDHDSAAELTDLFN
jgi:glucosamine-6-phosphate deaminase